METRARAETLSTAGVLALLALAGGAGPASAQFANVYSSLPQQGTSRGQTAATQNGMRLALEEAGGSAGGLSLSYIPLDDSSRANPGTADAGQTRRNALRAAGDPLAIAYLGEFNSGGSKVSIPILNRAGILQISPSNTYIGLTRGGPGAVRGEPGRYYPTGRRTYGRIQPNDIVQAAALAALAKRARCSSAFLVNDGSVYGAGITTNVRRAAPRAGLRIAGSRYAAPQRASLERLAAAIRSPCVIYGGVTFNGALPTFRVLGARLPRVRFFASDGVAESAFTAALPTTIARRVLVTVSSLDPGAVGPAARSFSARYRARYRVRAVDPNAMYGYETMRLALDAINRAAPRSSDRAAVVDAFFATRNRDGVFGRYSIDGFGDTTFRGYGTYRITRRVLAYAGAVFPR